MILLYINKGLVVKTSIIAFFSDYKMIAFNFISAIDNSFFEFISKKKKKFIKKIQTRVCVCVCVFVSVSVCVCGETVGGRDTREATTFKVRNFLGSG